MSAVRVVQLRALPDGRKVLQGVRADGSKFNFLEPDQETKDARLKTKRREHRGTLHRLRDAAHHLAPSGDRRCACGKVLAPAYEDGRKLDHPSDLTFYQSKRTGLWYATGMIQCGNAWACPVCAYEIHAQRADYLRALIADWWGEDRCAMSTKTVRHNLSMSLKPLRRGLTNAHRRMSQGNKSNPNSFAARNASIKARLGEVHHVRGLEVTHGPVKGWHPHLHDLHLCDRPQRYAKGQLADWLPRDWSTVHALSDIGREMNAVWHDAVMQEFRGDSAYEPNEHGVDLSPCSVATYVAKMGFAEDAIDDGDGTDAEQAQGSTRSSVHLEMTSPLLKDAKGKNRAPWQILDAYSQKLRAGVDASNDARLWRDFCAGIMGAHQLEFSRGVKLAFEEWLRGASYWFGNRETDKDGFEAWLSDEAARRGFEVEYLRREYADPDRAARLERVLAVLDKKQPKVGADEVEDEGDGAKGADAPNGAAAPPTADGPAEVGDERKGALPHYVWALIARVCSVPVLIMAGERGGWPAVVEEVAARAERAMAQLYDSIVAASVPLYLPVDEADVESAVAWIDAELAKLQPDAVAA